MTLVETQDDIRHAPSHGGKAARGTTSRVYPLTKDLKRRAQAA